MRTVIFDIEANSLAPTIIWCVVCKEIETGKVVVFPSPHAVANDFPSYAATVDTWIGHNAIIYDVPALNRLVPGVTISLDKVKDTLVMSRLYNVLRKAERLFSGYYSQHSLESWAIRLGSPVQKVAQEQWTIFDPNMVTRCKADVEITEQVYNALLKEGEGFSKDCLDVEQKVAFINEQQKLRGFKLDFSIIYPLQDELVAKEKELRELILRYFPPIAVKIREVVPSIKLDGELSNRIKVMQDQNVVGPYTLIHWQDFNMGSPQQVVHRMDKLGWKPYMFTEAGQAQCCDENFATLPEGVPLAGKVFLEYRTVTGRLGKVREVLNGLQEDGRVHGECLHIGASTHRMAHNNPNMANIPAVDSPYGDRMRQMFHVEEGWTLVGTDASGIQLRLLAHYINDPKFTEVLLNADIHNYMASIYTGTPIGDITKELRTKGKTLTYAICFGAGAQRAASIFGISKEEGQTMINRVHRAIPGLKRLKEEGNLATRKGFTMGLDGRKLPVMGNHLYLPALLQGGEQSIMKLAKILWYNMAPKAGIPMYPTPNFKAAVLADVHDEWQTEVLPQYASTLGKLQVWALEEAGRRLQLNCPITGASRKGNNWKETH